MKRSTSGTWRRIRSSAWLRYGSIRPSRNRSSPCSVQQIGRFSARLSGAARPISSEFGRLMTSGTGSSASHSSSLSNSLRSTPRSPSSIEIVRSPSSFGSVEIDRLANALMIHGESHSRSRNRGRLAEERDVLLQVDADAAEQHLLAADVGLVGIGRRVERQQRHVVAAAQQLDRQRVVARAGAAVHPRGAGGDRQDIHIRSRRSGTPAPGTESRRCSLRAAAASSAVMVGIGPMFSRSMCVGVDQLAAAASRSSVIAVQTSVGPIVSSIFVLRALDHGGRTGTCIPSSRSPARASRSARPSAAGSRSAPSSTSARPCDTSRSCR